MRNSPPDTPAGEAAGGLPPLPPVDVEIGERRNRPGWKIPRTTAVLAGLALMAVGFLGGIEANSYFGTSATAGSASEQGSDGDLAARRAQGRGNAGAGNLVVGTVKSVNGKTLQVQTPTGEITVNTGDATKIKVSRDGTLTDLPAGASITVQLDTPGGTAVTITEGARSGLGGARPSGRPSARPNR